MYVGFSSPSGDGLVSDRRTKESIDWLFSSPGGVGLFHFTRTILLSSICFRPRLGMGWFMRKEKLITRTITIFVPAWGWVGSHMRAILKLQCLDFRPRLGLGWFLIWTVHLLTFTDFRPRLGMGWFMIDCSKTENYFIFSSPSGVGLVHNCIKCWNQPIEFSSPSGDGLVQEHGTSYSYGEYFRPRSGLGWFTQYSYTCV